MSETHQRESALFDLAMELPAEQRATYLDQACGNDAALRQRIEALLKAGESKCEFLNSPADPALQRTIHIRVLLTEKPGDRIGRYKLLEQIGEGGCGVVYVAEQIEPVRRRVALKIIKLGMDTKSVIARFEAERQALALMDHPNIAKVFDAGATETGRPYFVMELVRGIKITEYCDEAKLPTNARLDLFIQVCQAIQHAHQKGIIHRDIKPSNILVTVNDGVAVPKVIDFGVAKATSGQLLTDKTIYTAFEQFIGTPAYMSPEQAVLTSLDIDTRSDIYALGVLLYELLTGRTPFDARELLAIGLDEMRRTIREQEPQRPSTRLSTLAQNELSTTAQRRGIAAPKLVSELRGDLDWIVMKALEKDRARRYETANGLAADIQRHLNCEPVVARPPSRWYEFQKTVRRHKIGFAATAAVIVALASGLALSGWMFVRERAAVHEQNRLRQQAQTEAAKSQQVSRFLQDMLQGVGPSVAKGRDTTMLREIADKTALRLNSDLADQPEVEADLRTTLGMLYLELGDFTNSSTLLHKALDLRKGLYGEENASVADSLEKLAMSLESEGRLEEAEAGSREALALWNKLLPAGDLRIADSQDRLAQTLRVRAKYPEAESLLRQALARKRDLLGSTNLAVAHSLLGLALVLDNVGGYEEAEKLSREALAIHKQTHGYDDPSVGHLFDALGMALERTGNYAEAESAYREGFEVRRRLLSDGHPHLGWSWGHLGRALMPQGRLAEAETAFREALAIRKRAPSSAHVGVSYAFEGLAACLRQAGKFAQEEMTYREWLVWAQKSNDQPGVLSALIGLGRSLTAQGKSAEADETFHECLERARQSGDRAGMAAALNDLAWLLATLPDSTLRDATNAISFALEAVTATVSTNSMCLDTLAAAYARAGEFTKAVAIQKEAMALLHDEQSKQGYAVRLRLFESHRPYCDHNALAAWVADLLAAGKFGDAEPLAHQCLTIREMEIPDDWRTFNARSMLGGTLLGQKKYTDAEPLLLSAYEGLKQREALIPAPGRPRIRETLQRLVQLYEATGKAVRVTEWKQKFAEFDQPTPPKVQAQAK